MSWEGHEQWAAKLHSETFLLLWTNGYLRYKAVENQALKLSFIKCKMFIFYPIKISQCVQIICTTMVLKAVQNK